MTKSDSLDNITLGSDDIKTIERFENYYYNHKKNKLQNGGNNKLEKNIERLFNYFLLSQNGGGNNSKLSNIIQTRLDNKIGELIVYKNYFNIANNLEGGMQNIKTVEQQIKDYMIEYITVFFTNTNTNTNTNKILKDQLITYIQKINIDHIMKGYVNKKMEGIGNTIINKINKF